MLEENGLTTEPMRRTTQLDFAVEALRNAILNGEVGLGERVNEVAFTTKWGISRTTFREALRQMEQAGLLVRIPFRGTFVRDFTEEEIDSLNNLRGALETYAVERIIEQDGHRPEKLEPFTRSSRRCGRTMRRRTWRGPMGSTSPSTAH